MLRLGINPEKKILTVNGEEHHFTEILMSKDRPFWKVKLADGGALLLNFKPTPSGKEENNGD